MKLSGLGSDIKDQSVLFNKAKRKLVTQQIASELISIAQQRGEKEMEKSLWNTYYCLNDIVVSDHKIYGSYCKNRICTTCNSIRKAEIINKYFPVIESRPELQLVTLTAKSCYGAPPFDLQNPEKKIGKLKSPLFAHNAKEWEVYISNVVYLCGSILQNDGLVIPYAMA